MNLAEYDTQESKEPHDAILEIKKGMSDEAPGREDCDREVGIQACVRMVKMHSDSPESDPHALRDLIDTSAPDAAYCKSRLEGDISPLLRWHYYVALFCAMRGDWLGKAIPLILESAAKAGGPRAATYLLIGHNLNRWYNCGLDGRVLDAALEFVRGGGDRKFAHWIVEIVAALEKRPGVRDEMRDLLIEEARAVEAGMVTAYLEPAMRIAHDKAPAKAAWVEILERHADEERDPMLKIRHYNDAKRYLDDADAVRRINQKTMTAQKYVKLTAHTYDYKISTCPVRGQNGFERVKYLVQTLRRSIPTVESACRLEQEMRDRFPIQHLFPRITVGDDGIPGQISEGPSMDDAVDHVKQFASTITTMSAVISASVGPYEKDGHITAESYAGYIELFGLQNGATMRLIRAGVKAHSSGDYVAAIHILLPQLEQTLRSLLVMRGVNVVKGKKKVRVDLLKPLIELGVDVLGRDLAEFLKVWLVDEGESINLRNRVCHGMYADYENMEGYDPLHEFHHGMSLMLILAICMLTAMSTDVGGPLRGEGVIGRTPLAVRGGLWMQGAAVPCLGLAAGGLAGLRGCGAAAALMGPDAGLSRDCPP